MITFQEESFIEAKEEFAPLLKLQWIEISRDSDKPLDVNYDMYEQLEDAGVLYTTTARKDGQLIGYILTFVSPNLHCISNLRASTDVLFVHPDYRQGGTFVRLLKFTEKYLAKEEIELLHVHMKTTHDFSKILVRYGYTEIERNFEKNIGD